MNAAMWLRNLAALMLQLGVLVGAGAGLARAFRIDTPRPALAYWRLLLLACLFLPLAQPWHAIESSAVAPVLASAAAHVGTRSLPVVAPTPRTWPSIELLVVIGLSIGVAARGLWLLLGAWALGRIRRGASILEPLPEPVARAEERVGVTARFFVSSRVAGPITFGVRQPVIVFPPGITTMDSTTQHAIACHELLHVRRRDWVYQVVEECIRTALWFHPCVWWLIGRIQLTREQVVDQETVALLGSREQYVTALLTVATVKSAGFLTPAPAFFRRGLLKKRVAHILQESTMTTRRLMVSLGASAGVLALAATMAVRSFPLQAQGQPRASSGKPVEIVKGGEHLLHGEAPEYPRRAIGQKVEGDVLLDLAIDDQGEVSDARVLSGPEELRRATLEAALGWHYSPSAIRSQSVQATVHFSLPAANAEFKGVGYAVERKEANGELTRPQQLERMIDELRHLLEDDKVTGSQREEYKAKLAEATKEMEHINAERRFVELHEVRPDQDVSAERVRVEKGEGYNGPVHLVKVETERVSADAAAEVMQRAGLKIGDTVTEQSLRNLRAAASAVDEHFAVVTHDDGHGGVALVLVSRE